MTPRLLSVRYAGYYAAVFLALGVYLPFQAGAFFAMAALSGAGLVLALLLARQGPRSTKTTSTIPRTFC